MQYLETLLGEQGLKIAWWLAAFIIVLVLVVVVLRLLKSLTGGRLNVSDRGARGRAPRLGVTEYFNLDRQGRRLVIIRRDNIEHLVLIGGPNDVLIESSIVRGERMAPRSEGGYGRAEGELAGTPEPVVAARPLPDFTPAAPEQREPQPETRLPPPPAVNDRTPVADIPPDHLAQRLEEVLRKPLAPRVEVQAPATVRSEPSPVRAGPMAGFTPPRPPVTPSPATPSPVTPPPVMSAAVPPVPAVPEMNVPAVKAPEPVAVRPALPDLLADALRPRPPVAPQPPVTPVAPARGPAAAFTPPVVRTPEPRIEAAPAEPAAKKPEPAAPAMPAPPAVVKPQPPALTAEPQQARPEPPLFKPAPPAPKPEPEPAAAKPEPVLKSEPLLKAEPAHKPEPAPATEPPAAQPAKPAASANPFDSLEEEMAKLLGRGLGDKL